MALDIVWSPRAIDNFSGVLEYLEENWNGLVTQDFARRTNKVIKLISEHPQMFRQISSENTAREAVIIKHNLLLYKIHKNQILIIAVFDTRKHPRKKIF